MRRPIVLAALAVGLLVTSVACSDDDEEEEPIPQTGNRPTTTTTSSTTSTTVPGTGADAEDESTDEGVTADEGALGVVVVTPT